MAAKKEIKINIADSDQENAGPPADPADERPEQPAVEEVIDETEASTEAETPEAELTEEERLRLKVAELEDRLLRAQADFENYKKRVARQYETVMQSANERLLTEILEIVDNFERAFEHAEERAELNALTKGIELIHGQMVDLLGKHGVEAIEAVGEPFDPRLHEALMQVASDEYDEGIVALEMGKGYRQGERVLRYSKVGVSAGKEKPSESE